MSRGERNISKKKKKDLVVYKYKIKYLVEGGADGSNGTSKQRNQSDHRGEEIKSEI